MDDATRLEGEETGERTMRILPKTIGRNAGFVVEVQSLNQTNISTFYAKVQSVSMDTVLIHNLLKNMKCGPDMFYIPILDLSGRLYHGIITKKIVDWKMVNSLTVGEQSELFGEKDRLVSATFLLNVLIELGRFGNIPNNGDNWGFIDSINFNVAYPGASLVDFSRGGPARKRFRNEQTFRLCWKEILQHIFDKWETFCEPSYNDYTALHSYLRREDALAEQADQLPLLHSQKAFTDHLQSACDATAQWLHETIARARSNAVNIVDNGSDISPQVDTVSDSSMLQPFRHVSCPNLEGLSYHYQAIVTEYLQLVREWNESLCALCEWFPFPRGANGAQHIFGRYALSCFSTDANACEGDVGEETEWYAQFATPAQTDVHISADENENLLDALMSPYTIMITHITADDVTVHSPSYIITKGPAPYYEERICCMDRSYRDRSLSMERNVCEGDVGEDTEWNAKFMTTPATSNAADGLSADDILIMQVHPEDVIVYRQDDVRIRGPAPYYHERHSYMPEWNRSISDSIVGNVGGDDNVRFADTVAASFNDGYLYSNVPTYKGTGRKSTLTTGATTKNAEADCGNPCFR